MRNPFRDELSAARARVDALERENRELKTRLVASQKRDASGSEPATAAMFFPVALALLAFFGVVYILSGGPGRHRCQRGISSFDGGRAGYHHTVVVSPSDPTPAPMVSPAAMPRQTKSDATPTFGF